MIINKLKKFGEKVCILNNNVTYRQITEYSQHNYLILEKYCKNRIILLDISLGWRMVPIILGALMAKITIVPIDLIRTPYLEEKLFPDYLLITSSNIDYKGKLITTFFEKSYYHNGDEELKNIAFIMFSSGTTGKPKGIKLTYENVFSNTESILDYSNLNSEDRVLIIRPFTNISAITGELLPSLLTGASIFIKDLRTSPLACLETAFKYKINILFTTPSIALKMLCFDKESKLQSIKLLILSGEQLTKGMYHKISAYNPKMQIWNAYGLSEASPRISIKKIEGYIFETGCIGRTLKGVKYKIINETGNWVNEGETGELWVCGPNIMDGYYLNKTLTQKKKFDGWLATGDLAYFKNGELFIKGRKDNMIIKYGMNIFPEEIEEAICSHPEVVNALVFTSYINEQLNINAKVIKNVGSNLSAEEIHRYLILNYKDTRIRVDQVMIDNQLEYTPSGKVLRK
ncbi:fatty acid--CoA ligase family protein [Bacillus sp. 166amftsu]|uniref:class I adenylate-forming enzyme family protein n=1 Tax=Bacillus sp. 166amftsu TaxID=1761753 RepID=UPI000A81327C|nr:fatty acid--CoA ligase family protein [Bacillus sp. 166amftsu]